MHDASEHTQLRASAVWEYKTFEALSGAEVYALLRLRAEVFVVEQDCVFLDPDGLDTAAFHCMAWHRQQLVAYQRCLPPGTPYAESSIGRIVSAPSQRGKHLGRELLRRGIAFNHSQWPGQGIRLGAQYRLHRFYESLGFRVQGEPYMEDGIEHCYMLMDAPRAH